jgi:hypothetical protein
MQKLTASKTGSNTKMTDPLERSKRRLMGIAMQTSACLLLNMVHTLRLFVFGVVLWCLWPFGTKRPVENYTPCHDYFQG